MGIASWTLPRLPDSPWVASLERHLAHPVKDFVGKVLGMPPVERLATSDRVKRSAARAERRSLPFDVYLTLGTESVRLFTAGAIDEFRFFQRASVSTQHEVEFLTRLEPGDAGTENYKAFAVFRLKGTRELPDLERHQELRSVLARRYGLDALPGARDMLQDRPPSTQGALRIAPPRSAVWRKIDGRRFGYADVLEILRHELTGPEKVAWIEDAFAPPPPGETVHRYYIDPGRQAYLVRSRAREKAVFVAETSEEALRACLSSDRHRRTRKAG